MDDKTLIEYYKVIRNSVEHFDRLLAHFRQIMFAFNGIFISTGVTFFLANLEISNIRYIKLFLISNLLAVINILIWLLEKHYHRYLIVSANLASKIEKQLFLSDEKCLTYQLGLAKGYRVKKEKFLWYQLRQYILYPAKWISNALYRLSPYIRTYDLIYLLPILGSVGFNLFLAHGAQANANINWLLWVSYPLLVIYPVIGTEIIVHNYCFEKSFSTESKT